MISKELKERIDYAIKLSQGTMPIQVVVKLDEIADALAYLKGKRLAKTIEISTEDHETA